MQSPLSQDDINQLIGSTSAPDVAARSGPSRGTDVHAYDFRRPHRISKERLRTLEAMYERVAKGLEGWLVSRLRGHVEITLQSVEQCSFGEFVQSLQTPCTSYMFDIDGGDGAQGLIDMSGEFSYFLIDRLFGGSGKPTVLNRPLSLVERLAARMVVERACSLLEEVWRDHIPLSLGIASFESSPDMLQIVNREDPVLIANFEAAVEEIRTPLVVCFPFGVLEKFFQMSGQRRVGGATRDERARVEARQRAELALRSTSVAVAARLPTFQLTLRELSALTPGQVIETRIQRDAPLSLLVGQRQRYTGSAGRIGQRLAVRVDEVLDDPNESMTAGGAIDTLGI